MCPYSSPPCFCCAACLASACSRVSGAAFGAPGGLGACVAGAVACGAGEVCDPQLNANSSAASKPMREQVLQAMFFSDIAPALCGGARSDRQERASERSGQHLTCATIGDPCLFQESA